MAHLHIPTTDVDATRYAITQLDTIPHGCLTFAEPRKTWSSRDGWIQQVDGPRWVLVKIAHALDLDIVVDLRDDEDDDEDDDYAALKSEIDNCPICNDES